MVSVPHSMARVYLGFGGNLGDVRATLDRAVEALPREGVQVLRRAPLFRTAPMGPPGQPDYLNTALEVDTDLDPAGLLAAVKRVEVALGRVPGERWGPRALDLDVLLYDDLQLAAPTLTVPHAGLTGRRFVLAPLACLVPDTIVPGTAQTVAQHLAALTDDPATVVREP